MEFGIILLILLIFAFFAYFSYLGQQQRLDELRELASKLGWDFQAADDYDQDDKLASYPMFCQGSSRYAFNTLRGAITVAGAACPVMMGDYHYKTTSHDSKGNTTTHTHIFSYLLLELPYRRLPELIIRREGLFDAVKNLFGFDDIDFESAEFSRRFCVKSPDRRFAYDVIHSRMIEFLMEYEPPTINIAAGRCLLGDGSATWTAEEFRATVDWVEHFFELWPQHLTSQLERKSPEMPLGR